MEIRRIVGKNIEKLRKDLGLSQEGLAFACGRHRTYISGVERGVRNPTITVIAEIAHALKVPPSRLLDSTGAKSSRRK